MTPKEIVKDFSLRLYSNHDFSAIHDYFDKDALIHSIIGDFKGIDFMVKIAEQWERGFPITTMHSMDVIGEGEYVAVHIISHGKHMGEFSHILPTHHDVNFKVLFFFRVQNQKITEYSAYLDMEEFLSYMETK